MGYSLRRGDTVSCGCFQRQNLSARSKTHGLGRHRLRKTWESMKERCFYAGHTYYDRYGGRGITVCERWMDLTNFVADNEHKWRPGYSLERIDNNGPYSPDNCTWIPRAKQARNKSTTIYLTYCGKTQPLVVWAEETGMSIHALRNRYYDGWPDDKILGTPVKSPTR